MQFLDEANAVSGADNYDERMSAAPIPAAAGTTSGIMNSLSQSSIKKPNAPSAIPSSSSSKDAAKKIPHSQKKGDTLSKLSGRLL